MRLATKGCTFAVGCVAVILSSAVATPQLARADDYFIESDDYQEGEELVGTFLHEPDYAVMIESIKRNGIELDWGWALTPGWVDPAVAAADAPPKKGFKALIGRLHKASPRTVQEPRQLGFDLKSYSTVYIAPVQNSVGIVDKALQPQIHEYLEAAMKELGLRVVAEADSADLEVGTAIVDLNGDVTNVYVYNIQVQPFIEIELRLQDRKANQTLLLVRHQSHSQGSGAAALRYANQLIQFLR